MSQASQFPYPLPLSRTDHVTSNAFIASACDAAGEVVALVAATSAVDELSKLRAFFREVAELTKEHDVLDDHAVVYPNKLGEALERVDPNWAGEVVALVRTCEYNGGACQRGGCADGCQAMRLLRERNPAGVKGLGE